MQSVWEDQVALRTQEEARFEALPAAKSLSDRTSWSINPESLDLKHGLDWYLERDNNPLPKQEDREGYFAGRDFEYWLSGLQDYQLILDACDQYDVGRECFVDLGSASGRVVRHMAAYGAFKDCWAMDINWRHIYWMQSFLPMSVKPVNTSSMPLIPLPDHSVDCMTAMSVFTHIESFETAWLAEIRRVLKPNGIVIFTVVTEEQLGAMDETWPLYAPIVNHPRYTPSIGAELQAVGKLIFRYNSEGSYSSNVIYSHEYIQRAWGRIMRILEVRRQFPVYQDRVIMTP